MEEKLEKSQKIHHFYKEKDIKKEYKFWNTQLVPQFNQKLPIELGPLKLEFKEEDIRKIPYELPENMEWIDIDITKEEELTKVYDFLNINYYEVDEYKEQYNKEFLRWQFSPIKNSKHKNIFLSIQINKKLIGFFAGLPMKLSVYGKEILVYNITFLCIDKGYRNINLAEIMFKEMFRRSYMEKIYQNIFVTQKLIPKPFCESTYYFKPLNFEDFIKLKENGYLLNGSDIKQFENKRETSYKFRPMEKKDIKSVTKLLYENQKNIKYIVFFLKMK